MGLRDLFRRRKDPAFFDPRTVDSAEALAEARKGLAETDTYIDQNGNRRKLPPGAKAPLEEALDEAERRLGAEREVDGDIRD
jgi:hypothetical protein